MVRRYTSFGGLFEYNRHGMKLSGQGKPAVRRQILLVSLTILLLSFHVLNAQDKANEPANSPAPQLKVWLPAPLISDESGKAYQLLREHTAEFSASNNIDATYRIKDVGKIGGIVASIRAGKEVAPEALPDVALIRRRDFGPALASEYLQSLETLFSSSLLNDLDDSVEFGQIPLEGGLSLYGLPYFFDLLLSVYTQPAGTARSLLSFDDMLSDQVAFLFPAARTNGLNQTFYLQYLAAGGMTPDDGVMSVNEGALLTVLEFYDLLVQQKLITADVLTYQSPSAYAADFANQPDRPQLAIFNASDYLAMIDRQAINVVAAEIPTADGNGSSILNGWLWVIVTPDRGRQALAARFLEWMMEPAFHADFAKALYHLPSQPAILGQSLPAAADSQFFSDLLFSAALPLPEGEGGTAPRLMQEALVHVLHGDLSAAEATRQVLEQLAER